MAKAFNSRNAIKSQLESSAKELDSVLGSPGEGSEHKRECNQEVAGRTHLILALRVRAAKIIYSKVHLLYKQKPVKVF